MNLSIIPYLYSDRLANVELKCKRGFIGNKNRVRNDEVLRSLSPLICVKSKAYDGKARIIPRHHFRLHMRQTRGSQDEEVTSVCSSHTVYPLEKPAFLNANPAIPLLGSETL